MAPVVTDTPAPVPPSLLAPLQAHLPYSFAVLRRAQFTHHPQGTTPHAHFLFASDPDEEAPSSSSPPRDGGDPGPGPGPRHFAAAYLDLSQHPETQMYLYSTLQDAGDDTPADTSAELEDRALDLIMALLAHVRHVAAATAAEARHPLPEGDRGRGLMVGGLHERTYRLLVARRGVASSYWNPHDVWLFRVEDLPPAPPPSTSSFLLPGPRDHHQQQQQQQEEEDLRWDVVREDDVPLIASRTKIPKVARTLMSEPSVAVRDGEALVAWGFIGTAGTLSTLHVEVSSFSGPGKGGHLVVSMTVLTSDNPKGAVPRTGHSQGDCYEGDAGS